MKVLNSYSTKNKVQSAKIIKNNIRILKYFKNTNNSDNSLFPKVEVKKNNNSLISNLLNTSKKLVKNNSRYKLCTNLPKSFQHYYPYNPIKNRSEEHSKRNQTNSKITLIQPYNAINSNNSRRNNNTNIFPKESKFKLNFKHFNFINFNVNEDIFFDFLDGYNNNSILKEKYNNYLLNHPIENENDINIFQLFDMLQNFKIDYNDNNYFNENSSSKINKFKLKNNLSVKIKISSLNILFYKIKHTKKNIINNKDYLFDNSNNKTKNKNYLITKLKFPFGFLPFFYGINNIEFLKFLIAIIDYDYSKNIFYIDFKKFMKNYRLYIKEQSFFGETSYFQIFLNKNKEFFEYDWDVKNKNDKITNHYIMKITLPQIKIGINFENKNIAKFYYSIDTHKMIYLIKQKFKLWDFHILKFFSEFKLFRQEINKIICDKLLFGIKANFSNEENKSNINNNINYNKELYYKKAFNFNRMNTKNSMLGKKENSFEFFYSQNINEKNEGYFFQIQIPKIHIIYQDQNFLIDKFFDLDIKRMSQINKLRKSFQIEDIIKYSMIIVDEKNKIPTKRKASFFENNGYRRSIKRSSTLKSDNSFQRLNLKTISSRVSVDNSNKMVLSKFKITQLNKNINCSSIKKINSEEARKDIKLNLDKYIFNFDDDILKFIKPLEEEKDEKKSNFLKYSNEINKRKIKKEKSIKSIKRGIINGMQANKNVLNVEIGKIKLFWTCNDLKEYEYFFEEKESSYLLDNPTYTWEKYIENNLKEYINSANILDNNSHI